MKILFLFLVLFLVGCNPVPNITESEFYSTTCKENCNNESMNFKGYSVDSNSIYCYCEKVIIITRT